MEAGEGGVRGFLSGTYVGYLWVKVQTSLPPLCLTLQSTIR